MGYFGLGAKVGIPLGSGGSFVLAKQQFVPKWVGQIHTNPAPKRIFYGWPVVFVIFGCDGTVPFAKSGATQKHLAARGTIACVFGKMQGQIPQRDLHVQGHSFLKTMLPINLKSQPVAVVFPGFLFVKNPDEWDGLNDLEHC